MAASVIGRGLAEIRAIAQGTAPALSLTRSRRPGGGRKKAIDKNPTLLADLRTLVESTTRGDPESPLLWTARSQRHLVAALAQQGHQTSMNTVVPRSEVLSWQRTQSCQGCSEDQCERNAMLGGHGAPPCRGRWSERPARLKSRCGPLGISAQYPRNSDHQAFWR